MRCLAEDLGPSGPACQDIWATTLEPGRWLLRRVNIQGARQPDIRHLPNLNGRLQTSDRHRAWRISADSVYASACRCAAGHGTMALRTIFVVCPAVTVTGWARVTLSSLSVPLSLTVMSWGEWPYT